MTGRADRWIRRTTIGCVALLALIAGTVSYLHMHLLVELHGQPGWVAALTPLSMDGMIVAASTTLLAESRSGDRGGLLPWALLVAGSAASLAANLAVAEPTATGRVIAAWPSFALIASYELLMRQVRRAAEAGTSWQRSGQARNRPGRASSAGRPRVKRPDAAVRSAGRGREGQVLAWQWALANRPGDGSLPSGRDIGRQHGRHERWGRSSTPVPPEPAPGRPRRQQWSSPPRDDAELAANLGRMDAAGARSMSWPSTVRCCCCTPSRSASAAR